MTKQRVYRTNQAVFSTKETEKSDFGPTLQQKLQPDGNKMHIRELTCIETLHIVGS